jgi:hypothetical protein
MLIRRDSTSFHARPPPCPKLQPHPLVHVMARVEIPHDKYILLGGVEDVVGLDVVVHEAEAMCMLDASLDVGDDFVNGHTSNLHSRYWAFGVEDFDERVLVALEDEAGYDLVVARAHGGVFETGFGETKTPW